MATIPGGNGDVPFQ